MSTNWAMLVPKLLLILSRTLMLFYTSVGLTLCIHKVVWNSKSIVCLWSQSSLDLVFKPAVPFIEETKYDCHPVCGGGFERSGLFGRRPYNFQKWVNTSMKVLQLSITTALLFKFSNGSNGFIQQRLHFFCYYRGFDHIFERVLFSCINSQYQKSRSWI